MKRLVKTAKQQFDEALNSLKVLTTYEYTDTDILYGCEGEKGFLFILREINGEEFYRYSYNEQWDALFFSERFLRAMTSRFIEIESALKPLFDWYLSADHDDEPFTLDDIWMCDLEVETTTFEDIYEEVPDLKTAQDKFNERLKEVGLWDDWYKQCCSGRIGIELDNEIIIFAHEDVGDGYSEYHYPCFAELRKDSAFQLECMREFSCSGPEFVAQIVYWLTDDKQKCPLEPVDVYFPANFLIKKECSIDFKDDQPEQSIEEMLKLTEKQLEAVRMIEEGVRMLYSNGGKIFQYYDDNLYYAVNGEGLVFQSTNYEDEKLKGKGYLDVSDVVGKQRLNFYNSDWAVDGRMYAKKSN